MESKKKLKLRKLLGEHLKKHREESMHISSVRQLSFSSNLDQSKLSKIEKGLVDFRFDTLVEIALTYQLNLTNIFDFEIDFWNDEDH